METITEKQEKIEKKVSDAKKRVAKRVKAGLQEPVKPETATDEKKPKKVAKKPDNPQEWLSQYISQGEVTTSSAKLATFLLNRNKGAKMSELIARCSEISDMKGSAWGKSKGSLKSHLRFLQQKGCTVTKLGEDHYKISA